MVTYLCGGINGLSDSECNDWRQYAKDHLKGDTLDPMRRDYRGREDECVNEIVAGDLEDIANSDNLLVSAVRPSWGTAMEIKHAHDAGKLIVAFVEPGAKVSPWLRFHCHKIVSDLDAAIECLNAFDA